MGLQDLGAYVRVGAVPLNHVCMNGSRLIIEEWVYCMSQVYADYRRGDENITLQNLPEDRFIGAPRRHAEWLACAAAIYWTNVYRRGYVNYFVLEFEAELARQDAIRQVLKTHPDRTAQAKDKGLAARDAVFDRAKRQPHFLHDVGRIPHIRKREQILRAVDAAILDRDVRETIDREIAQTLGEV
jgi:hypothetical protein